MHIQNGDTHITNNYYFFNSDNAAVPLPYTPPPPQRAPERANWWLVLVKVLGALAPALATYAAKAIGG